REIGPLRDLKAWLRLYRIFRELLPDVVHAHSSKAGFLARTAAWAAGVPKVFYSPRGYAFQMLDRFALSRLLYRALEASVSWIGEVVACSESEAELARGLPVARVRVARDAYLGELPPEISPQEGPVVIAASGRMSFPRNPEAFVTLAKRLTDAGAQARCLWIGGGELEGPVREMIRRLALEGKLEATGWLPHEEALARLKTASIFVHYSRWEGLPNSVLEAMALGLPVVASDLPSNRELVRPGENGFFGQDRGRALRERARAHRRRPPAPAHGEGGPRPRRKGIPPPEAARRALGFVLGIGSH
ncbi:MAG: glycosyltransferase, partial [Elusimicrobiota bacterium]